MSINETVDGFETKLVHFNFCPVQDVILELAFPNTENLYKPKSYLALGLRASLQFSNIGEFINQAFTALDKGY